MRKFSVICVMLFALFAFNTCQAISRGIPGNEVALGGISLGMSRQAVKNIYGEPTKISHRKAETETTADIEEWSYGDTFKIEYVADSVIFVSSSGNNGIKTPSGLTFGSNQFDVRRYYGQTYNCYPNMTYSHDGVDYLFYSAEHSSAAIDFGFNGGKACIIRIYYGD